MTRLVIAASIIAAIIAGLIGNVASVHAQEQIDLSLTHRVMLAIKGQTGDASYDSAMFDLANDCTVIMVVDDANDSVSPFIYTRLACSLTDAQIEQLPEILGDDLYLMTNLYELIMPVISK